MAFCSEIFGKVLNMSVTAGIAILFILLIRLALYRAPKLFSYLLWGIVLFRLLVPVSWSSSLSVLNLVDGSVTYKGEMKYFTAELSAEEYSELSAEDRSGQSADGHSVLSVGDFSTVDALPTAEGVRPATGDGQTALEDNLSIMGGVGAVTGELSAAGVTRSAMGDAKSLLWPGIWLSGVLVLAIYSICSILRLHRRAGCSMRLEGNVYLADNISSPFVMGLLHPRIYLPSALEKHEREYILLHERCHIRRMDHVVKPLAFLALCIHWFNPLVWLAFVLAGKDMEMSCDEAVMGRLENDVRAEYAASLLHLATGRRIIAGTPLAFGEGNPKSRIKNVMGYKKPVFWIGLAAAVACVVAAVCLMSNPRAEKELLNWTQKSKAEDVEGDVNLQPELLDGFSAQNAAQSLDAATDENNAAYPGIGSLPDNAPAADKAIYEAIMEHNIRDDESDADFVCCSFVQLAELCIDGSRIVSMSMPESINSQLPEISFEEDESYYVYYGWALYGRYRFEDGMIVDAGGSHIPVELTFRVDGDGYTLEEYWEPGSGSYFVSDVREKFPAYAAEDGIDSQKYVRRQIRECYAQAVEYGHLDTDAVAERLLDAICQEPLSSSSPQDYIDAHFHEYREMLNYGRYTVEYCVNRFEQGGESGLEGHIMARVCEELLDVRDKIPVRADEAATGQEWYETMRAHGGSIIEEYIRAGQEPE